MIERWIRRFLSMGRRHIERSSRALALSETAPPIRQFTIRIFESELRAIAQDATSWLMETGGDLFGIWTETPVIHLATMAGPDAQRDVAHFRLDVEYLRDLSIELEVDWGLRYFGDWHSHHTLGLVEPSAGDRSRLVRLGSKNNFDGMAEIIVSLNPEARKSVGVYPYCYQLPTASPEGVGLVVLKGASPIREALEARGSRPEQNWDRWKDIPLNEVNINGAEHQHQLMSPDSESSIPARHALVHVGQALAEASNQSIEFHDTSFGNIVAVPVKAKLLVAIAFDRSWPCRVLEVDRIDRSTGSANPLNLEIDVDARVPNQVVKLYEAALRAAGLDRTEGAHDNR